MPKAVAAIVTVGLLLAGCGAPTVQPTPTPAGEQIAAEPTPTPSPVSTPVPSPTPTVAPTAEDCVRATAQIIEGQNAYWYWHSGPSSGCYDDLHDFLADVGLGLYDFVPGLSITFWTARAVDSQGTLAFPTPTVNPLVWSLPPTDPVDPEKKGPRLVNYAHRHDILENSGISNLEERLAQWDVIILNPDHHLSLEKIRATNPQITILIWITMRYPHPSSSLHRGYRPSWNTKTAEGEMRPWRGGEPITNPYAEDYAYVHHVLEYLEKRHELYDGVLYDCLWEYPSPGSDINEDGIVDAIDGQAHRSAVILLLEETKERFPGWIITGNPGMPWPPGNTLYQYTNGNMHENALGDQFGDPRWQFTWSRLNTALQESLQPAYHFIIADVRTHGRSQSDATTLFELTEDDRRRVRLGVVGAMLLDGAYFGFDRGDCLHGQVWWFDEYDADLGDPLGPYAQDRYGPGTFSREFEKGVIILNNGTSPIEVKFEKAHYDVSFHEEATSFVIPPNDARILLRVEPGQE